MAEAILAALIFVPIVIIFILRSNAALSFLVLCGAFTLITLGNADLKDLTGHLNIQLNSSTLNLILLGAPLLLTLLLTRHAFASRKSLKSVLHLITALCVGALLALVSVPLLNESLRTNFANDWGWINLQKIQTAVIAAGFVLSLFLVWFAGGHAKHGKKKH